MKTYKHLSEEDVKTIKKWAKSAKEASEQLNVVLNGIKRQMSKLNAENKTAKVIDANWKEFKEEFMFQMPHVVYPGVRKLVPCDWVKANDRTKFNVFFVEFREAGKECFTFGTSEDGSNNSASYIKGTEEVPDKVKFTHPSGYVEEIDAKDADGNLITKTVECKLVPREKTAWGYTETVINAFCAAADELLDRKKATEETNETTEEAAAE